MQKSVTPAKATLKALPEDLKVLILEYLSLSDYSTLQLASHEFYIILKNHPKLWAKHLFLQCLDTSAEEDDMFKKDFCNGTLDVSETDIDFEGMVSSKKMLETHFSLKINSMTLFSRFLDKSQSRKLVKHLFNSFKSPDYPVPILKKDIHFFSTNTSFQNFLTEVHFGLQSKPFTMDRRTTMVQTIIEKIKEALTNTVDSPMDIAKLMSIRWYSFDTVEKTSTISSKDTRGRKAIKTEKVPEIHYETHSGNAKNFDIDENESLKDLRNIKTRRSNSDEIVTANEAESRNECLGLIQEFYELIYTLAKNRCDIVSAYLKAMKKSQDLLSEYNKLWSSFSLTVIDVNRILSPFARFFNQIYNKNCQEAQNFPEFSIWRILVKVWLQEVFTPLSDRLQQAFRSTLLSVRSRENTFEIFKQICLQKSGSEGNLKEEVLCQTYRNISDLDSTSKEQELELLKGFYNAVGDLSYDEFTIFYWNCSRIGAQTPKGALEEFITQDTLQLYRSCKELLFVQSSQIASFLKGDANLIDHIFGSQLACSIKESQVAMLKNSLTEKFNSFIVDIESSLQGKNICRKPLNESESFNSSYHLNFSGIKAFLDLEEDLKEKISSDKRYREDLDKVIGKEVEKFNLFLEYLKGVNDGLNHHYQECEEVSQEMQFRGFMKIDVRCHNFFGLNECPSSITLKNFKEERKDMRKPNFSIC